MIVLAIALDYPIQLLAIFMWYCSYMELKKLSEPEGDGFYDSSKGYMGFEDGDIPPARPQPKKGLIRGWLQKRMAQRIQREIEEQQADDARMDELLAKLHREGKGALNADEHRFMDRMAERLRKKDE